MNLKELTESYQEYTLTEAYLTEGLKIFKESKNLYKIASKITSKLGSSKYNNPEAITVAKKLAADITKLGDEYKRVEDDFANRKLDRATATAKLKALKNSNDSISGYIKSAKTKSLLGKVGLGVVITGLGVLLGSIAMNPSLIASIGSGVKDFAGKIASFFGKNAAASAQSGAMAQMGPEAMAAAAQSSRVAATEAARNTAMNQVGSKIVAQTTRDEAMNQMGLKARKAAKYANMSKTMGPEAVAAAAETARMRAAALHRASLPAGLRF